MDDFVILTKTCRQLRTEVCRVHTELAALGLRVHEKKRFIGRTTPGFDLPGYTHHLVRILRPSTESVRRLKESNRRLYERGFVQSYNPMVQLAVGRCLRTRKQKRWR